MGGAAPVLTRRRAIALAALGAGLVAYGASAERLPGLPSGLDVLVHSTIVFPVFAAMIWIALPLANAGNKALLVIVLISGVVASTLTLLDVDSAANVAKLVCYSSVGFWFLTLFEELWWISLVAVLVPWVDIWSVAAGPTEYVVEQQPGFFEQISVTFPNPGETATVNVGPPDILFFALFLAAADRFALRVSWTWIGMTALLAGTLMLVWSWDGIAGLPALPAVCLGFLLPNADLLWRNVRGVRAQAPS
ncbi:MAG TPA: hypothetical protein VFU34_04615 [Gaiellaceae bacterium]|nr:hypothetical protein [Gaiellaceae bacterium]